MDLNSNEQINKEISSSESETENEHPFINDSKNIEMIRSKKANTTSLVDQGQIFGNCTAMRPNVTS